MLQRKIVRSASRYSLKNAAYSGDGSPVRRTTRPPVEKRFEVEQIVLFKPQKDHALCAPERAASNTKNEASTRKLKDRSIVAQKLHMYRTARAKPCALPCAEVARWQLHHVRGHLFHRDQRSDQRQRQPPLQEHGHEKRLEELQVFQEAVRAEAVHERVAAHERAPSGELGGVHVVLPCYMRPCVFLTIRQITMYRQYTHWFSRALNLFK